MGFRGYGFRAWGLASRSVSVARVLVFSKIVDNTDGTLVHIREDDTHTYTSLYPPVSASISLCLHYWGKVWPYKHR